MESFTLLYRDLTSNYDNVVYNFAYSTKGMIQSKYFNQKCDGIETPSSQLEVKVTPAHDKITTTSRCFPNGPNSNATYLMQCGSVSNAIIISTILSMDKDVGDYIPKPQVGVCSKGLSVKWPESTGMETPNKMAGLIPADMVTLMEEAQLSSITVTDTFMVSFIEQITDLLAFLGYHYDFVHGHLTHEDICFYNRDNQLGLQLCHLENASLSYNYKGSVMRVKRKPEGLVTKFISSYVPVSDDGMHFTLEKRMWQSTFKKLEVPYYRSFDYYTLILSCLSLEYFFIKVFSNFLLKSIIFDPLFDEDQSSQVYIAIRAAAIRGKPLSYDEIIEILKPLNLRCDAIDLVRGRLSKVKDLILKLQA